MIKLPNWLRRDKLKLPSWAKVKESTHVDSGKISICIHADTPGYIEEWFKLLNVTQPDRYWLEVAYQCAKLDLQSALVGTEYDPRTSGKSAEFHFSRASEWALKRFPSGKGEDAASRGKEARQHYIRVRGALPF